MATLSSLVVRIEGNTASLMKSVGKAEGRLKKFKDKGSSALKAVGKAASGLAIGGGLALAGFAAGAVKNFLDVGEELDKMSKRTGISVESLGELKFAAEQSGSSIESIEKATKKMAAVITDADMGLVGATDSLAALGLEADSLKKLSPEEQFKTIAGALSSVESASEKAALAQKIFGKAGTELIPLFDEGADGMAALRQQAQDLGIVMSTDAAAGAASFNDSINEMKSFALGLFKEFASKLLPKLAEFVRFLVSKKPEVIAFVTKVKEKAKPFFDAFINGVETLFPIFKSLVLFIVTNKPILIAAIVAVGVAIVTALGPVSLAVAALVGIVTVIGYVSKNWDAIWGSIVKVFKTITGKIESIYRSKFGWLLPLGPFIKGLLYLKDNWRSVWGAIQKIIEKVGNIIRKIVTRITSSVNSVRGAISAVSSVASTVASFVPGLASGGSVTRGGVVDVHQGERVFLPKGAQVQSRSDVRSGGGGVQIIFNGPVYGVDDFNEKVNQARLAWERRGNG